MRFKSDKQRRAVMAQLNNGNPKRDGSGKGSRANRGRGGCSVVRGRGQGKKTIDVDRLETSVRLLKSQIARKNTEVDRLETSVRLLTSQIARKKRGN